jgi:1,4-dihydroxy-2-naphthoate octaprenyltransferase
MTDFHAVQRETKDCIGATLTAFGIVMAGAYSLNADPLGYSGFSDNLWVALNGIGIAMVSVLVADGHDIGSFLYLAVSDAVIGGIRVSDDPSAVFSRNQK